MRCTIGRRLAGRALPGTLIASAALATMACSGDPPAATRPAGVDLASVRACELLGASEIEAATGIAVAPGEDVSQVGGRLPMCNWHRTGSDTDVVLSLLITQASYTNFDAFVASARESAFGDTLADADVEEVAGVGRFGVWMPEAMMLQAYGDAAMVQTQVKTAAGRDALEAAKTLAASALAQLR